MRCASLLTVALLASSLAGGVARAGGSFYRQGTVTQLAHTDAGWGDKVWKVYTPAVFRDGKLVVFSNEERMKAAKLQQSMMSTLRENPEFRSKFPKVIPTTRFDEALGGIEQSRRDGRSIDDLRGKARDRGERKVREAIELAERITGGEVNHDPANFMFDEDGGLRGWVSVAPRPQGRRVPVELVRELGSGANAHAYEVRTDAKGLEGMSVVKILKGYSQRRFPAKAPSEVLEKLTTRAAEIAKGVGTDERFTKRFGNIIPKTVAIAPGVLMQEFARGIFYDDLPSDVKDHAKDEIKEAQRLAKQLYPKVVFTGRKKNFLFDKKTGAITSWYDMISDGPKAYERAGVSERW